MRWTHSQASGPMGTYGGHVLLPPTAVLFSAAYLNATIALSAACVLIIRGEWGGGGLTVGCVPSTANQAASRHGGGRVGAAADAGYGHGPFGAVACAQHGRALAALHLLWAARGKSPPPLAACWIALQLYARSLFGCRCHGTHGAVPRPHARVLPARPHARVPLQVLLGTNENTILVCDSTSCEDQQLQVRR